MDNFIEESIDYLFYNGGFNLITGNQTFEFRIRPNGEIEVTSVNNHIKTIFTGEPEIYQFFAFLIFCDMYSSVQKSTIALCKDKNVSRNNLKALNRIYNIYKSMLSLSGEAFLDAITDDDPGQIDRAMLEKAYEDAGVESSIKFELLKSRIETYAYDFARRFEYWNNLYDEFLATEDYDPLHEYALVKMEELKNNIEANHPTFFTRDEALSVIFARTNQLELDLDMKISGGEAKKHYILNILISLYDYQIDIMDIVMLIKNAFTNASMNEQDEVRVDDFMEAIELSYLPDSIKRLIIASLNELNKKSTKKGNNIISFKPLN